MPEIGGVEERGTDHFLYRACDHLSASHGLSKKTNPTIRARKLVIVSAGALGTPSILELSGIGGASLLNSLDTPVMSDLPGVGADYQDHHLMLYPYKTNLESHESLQSLLSGRLNLAQAVQDKIALLAWNSIDVCSKLRPTDDEIPQLGSYLETMWNRDSKDSLERSSMLVGVVSTFLSDHKILNEDKDDVS